MPDHRSVKRQLARLAGLHQGCLETERRLEQAAHKLHDHHAKRAETIRKYLKPAGVDEGLETAYLEALREKEAAARLG